MKKLTSIIFLLLILIGVSAYLYWGKSSSENTSLNTSQKPEAVAQQFFDNLSAENYQMAVVDFSTQMRSEMSPKKLEQLKNELTEKVGSLVSLGSAEKETKGEGVVFKYHAEFEKEKDVLIKLVIDKENGQNKITGFWLDSPKLRS